MTQKWVDSMMAMGKKYINVHLAHSYLSQRLYIGKKNNKRSHENKVKFKEGETIMLVHDRLDTF